MLMTEVIYVVAIVTYIVYSQLIKCIRQTKMSLIWNTTYIAFLELSSRFEILFDFPIKSFLVCIYLVRFLHPSDYLYIIIFAVIRTNIQIYNTQLIRTNGTNGIYVLHKQYHFGLVVY